MRPNLHFLGPPMGWSDRVHSTPAMTAKYAHFDNDPMRRAVDTIGATIAAAMDRDKGGEIIMLRKI